MKRWTVLQSPQEDARWQSLSKQVATLGCANEYIPWTESLEAAADLKLLESFDHVRLSTRLNSEVLKHIPVQSSWTTLLGVVDGMNKTPLGWWPLCGLYESLGQLLVDLGSKLDLRGNVLIAGAGGAARIAIAAFFKAGFQDFLITAQNETQATNFIREVKSKFFGLQISWVPPERIVGLSGDSSTLINCTPGGENNELLTELSYLNFLKRPGLLLDFSRHKGGNLLIQEATEARVYTVNGEEIAARTDVLWAKWAFQVEMKLDVYRGKFAQP